MPRWSCRRMVALIAGQLRGRLAQGGVRRDRRGRGRGHRGRPDPGRLGDHGVLLADHLRRRGAPGGAHPGDDPQGGRLRCGPAPPPKLDLVGTVLSAAGLGLVVLGVLQSSTWGWVKPKEDSPVEPFGFSLTVFVIGFGAVLLWAFTAWQRRREADRTRPAGAPGAAEDRPTARRPDRPVQPEPDPDGRLLHDPALPAAGDRARRPGDRPQDAARSRSPCSSPRRQGPGCPARFPIRSIVRAGPGRCPWSLPSCSWPRSSRSWTTSSFAWSMAVLGVGMGLLASQLGNVVQSSVDASGRGEAGGLQFTGQQLGSSLGVALLGAIVLSGLTSVVRLQHLLRRADQQQLSPSRSAWRSDPGSTSCPPTRSAAAAQEAGLDEPTTPGARRRLRVGPAPGAQGGAPGGGLPGPALAGLHQAAAARGAEQGGPGEPRRERARYWRRSLNNGRLCTGAVGCGLSDAVRRRLAESRRPPTKGHPMSPLTITPLDSFGTGQVFWSMLWFFCFFIWIWLLIGCSPTSSAATTCRAGPRPCGSSSSSSCPTSECSST